MRKLSIVTNLRLFVISCFMKKTVFIVQILFMFGCSSKYVAEARTQASVNTNVQFKSCPDDPEKQLLRSNELQEIVKADQDDRKIPGDQIDWNRVSAADEVRAKRVAEIFAEGCFRSSRDYAAAALVFQHGVVPEHYYQAYLWSKKALESGDETQKQMIANAIDRYLISLGYKQIFGAQTFRDGPSGCHCLGATELTFSDKKRIKICGISIEQRITSLHESNKNNSYCEKIIYCDKGLKTPPKGLFPGIW